MKKHTGFTLIELMIVIAILALLAAIAWPQYTEFVRKSRRADVQADLSELSSVLEREFTNTNSYLGASLPFTASPRQGKKSYDLTLVRNVAGSTFTLTSTPVGDQTNDVCSTMTLSNTGAVTPAANCWK